MDQESHNERLSRISTLWTLVERAHAGPVDAATVAQRVLMQRYSGAVYRYLLGALRSEEAATDLFQEFALRFVRGDFRRANPERGRFRDYVKKSLMNLVNDRHKELPLQPLPDNLVAPTAVVPESEAPDAAFIESWREELLSRTWATLAETRPHFFTVLVSHVQRPDVSAQEKAEQLAAELEKPFTVNQFRVTLHRARKKFADLLIEEVASSLETHTDEQLLQELRDLNLLKLCRTALKRRGHTTSNET
jgi:RNA polymerase sigma-70 factor (ECF subfamily)